MSEKHLLTIGFIPADHGGGTISCGDPDGSGTREILVEIDDDAGKNVDTDQVLSAEKAQFFAEDCPFLGQIASDWATPLADGAGSLSGAALARCWGSFHDEPLPGDLPRQVAEEDDCGEFQNSDGEFNGKFFIRYQFEEDGEYFNEQVVVVSD